MTTATAPGTRTPKQRKPRPKPQRSIRVLVPSLDGTPAIIRITVDRKRALYAVTETPSEIGGRGFLVREISTSEEPTETYQCHATGLEQFCTCKGFLRHRSCKHRDGLAFLVENNLL